MAVKLRVMGSTLLTMRAMVPATFWPVLVKLTVTVEPTLTRPISGSGREMCSSSLCTSMRM